MRETIGKREVTNLLNKFSKEILPLKSIEEVQSLIEKLVPDAEEIQSCVEDSNYPSEFSVWFIIPRDYTGKHSKAEYKNSGVGDDFESLASTGSITIDISRDRNEFCIKAYAWFEYFTPWHEINGADLEIKEETFKIPLEYRKDDMDKLLSDIIGLSSGTMCTIISDLKVGEASCEYKLIDEVQKRFAEFTINTIESTEEVPDTWESAWNNFNRENSIVEIAYSLGYDESKVKPNYKQWKEADEKLHDLRYKLKDVLINREVAFEKLSMETLKELTYAYALKEIQRNCDLDNKKIINKIISETIPKILDSGFDLEFYQEYSVKGFDVLRNL